MWFSPACSIHIGEALGLYHAIRWIHELQFTNVDFEVDSKRVADYFNINGRGDVTEFGSIMESSIYFLNNHLTNSHVEFIRRQANEVAHNLAKAATSSTSFQVFDDNCKQLRLVNYLYLTCHLLLTLFFWKESAFNICARQIFII